jgi:hypothetical protein
MPAALQAPVRQSAGALHRAPSPQRAQAPPQSTSVSAPFFTPSLHAPAAGTSPAGASDDGASPPSLVITPVGGDVLRSSAHPTPSEARQTTASGHPKR